MSSYQYPPSGPLGQYQPTQQPQYQQPQQPTQQPQYQQPQQPQYQQPQYQQPQQPQYQQPQYQQPQQPQYQQPQQPQYQQPQQSQQSQTPPYWPSDTQTPPQYQEGAMPPQGSPNQMPTVYMADDQAAAMALNKAEQAAQARQALTNRAQWLKIPGPQGQVKWDSGVPIGYEGYADIFICPPWDKNVRVPFVEKVSHFYMSAANPKGKVLGCTDDDNTCLFCQARKLALASSDPGIQKSAKDWGRKRRQHLYNVIDLTNPQSHYGQDGIMRPLIFGAGPNCQSNLKRMFDMLGGINNFCNPQGGRPVRVTKKKTGPEKINVEWGAIHQDPKVLDQYYWGALSNLWNLVEQCELATESDCLAAIAELGWPVPGGQTQSQVPNSYNPNPAPPYGNPYEGQQGQQSLSPQGMMPPIPPQGIMPPGQGIPPPPLGVNQGTPPVMNPPPVSSAPPPPPGGTPQPGGGQAPL